jgi:mercuric ion transport protein
MRGSRTTLAGSVASGFLASACCIGPVVLTLLGVSGGALAHRLEPLRPYLLAVTYALLAGAFYLTYRAPADACQAGDPCAPTGPGRRANTILLWIGTAMVVLSTTFPWYSEYLF